MKTPMYQELAQEDLHFRTGILPELIATIFTSVLTTVVYIVVAR